MMTGLTARGVRKATKQLEVAGLIRVEKGGGDKSIRYWLTPELSFPLPRTSIPTKYVPVKYPTIRRLRLPM